MEKELIKTIKTTIREYNDETIVTESKTIGGEVVKEPRIIEYNKLLKKKASERVLVKETRIVDRRYSDDSFSIETKVYEVKDKEYNLVKETIKFNN